MKRTLLFCLATLVCLAGPPVRAGDPVPDVDVVLEQIPGGTIKIAVDREGVDEIWIDVLPEMVANDAVQLPPGWAIGRFSDTETGTLQLVGDPSGESGLEIRLLTPPGAPIFQTQVSVRQTGERWTPWLDRDDPSGLGDFETLADFVAAGLACAEPVAIECQTTGGVSYQQAGQAYTCDVETGGVCSNGDNATPQSLVDVASGCLDYRVRLRCSG